jgi:acetylornithine deacetylase/succinyl-diaminopimelate desuccinylase-like protein
VTVLCGPGALEVAHTRHEHVSIDEVVRAARLYAAIICETCL